MAIRRWYRGEGGRFVSYEQAAEEELEPTFYDTVAKEILTTPPPSVRYSSDPQEEGQRDYWEVSEQERVIIWHNFADDTPDSLAGFDPPDGVTKYRVFLTVEGNPDYPKGWASTEWLGMDVWNPTTSMIKEQRGASFHSIRFDRG